MLSFAVTLGLKLVRSRRDPLFSAIHSILSFIFHICSCNLFRDLRTLSFFGSQLSSVLPAACALFRKKGGYTPVTTRQGGAIFHFQLSIFAVSLLFPAHTNRSRVSPFLPLHTQKQGGGGMPSQSSGHSPKNVGLSRAESRGAPKLQRRWAACYITAVLRGYCAGACQNGT